MTRRNPNTGFTLVELMLSMTFVSILLLAIAILVLQISYIYNKGLTMRAVNEAGQLISSDIQRTLNTSVPLDTIFVAKPDVDPTGGRLCVGTTVYAWNFGPYVDKPDGFNVNTSGSRDILFVKFQSAGNKYCEPEDDGDYPAIPTQVTQLLTNGESNLALHTFTVLDEDGDDVTGQPVADDPSQRLYNVSLTIGTNDADFILANGCNAPANAAENEYAAHDDEYCGVNTFNFVARAGNRAEE